MCSLKSSQTANAVQMLKYKGIKMYNKAEMIVYSTLVEDVVYLVG